MLYKCLLYDYLNLNIYWGYLTYNLQFYYAICFSHVSLVSVLCSGRDILIWSSLSTYCFLIDVFLILYGL